MRLLGWALMITILFLDSGYNRVLARTESSRAGRGGANPSRADASDTTRARESGGPWPTAHTRPTGTPPPDLSETGHSGWHAPKQRGRLVPDLATPTRGVPPPATRVGFGS
jgi:hypothetical protein